MASILFCDWQCDTVIYISRKWGPSYLPTQQRCRICSAQYSSWESPSKPSHNHRLASSASSQTASRLLWRWVIIVAGLASQYQLSKLLEEKYWRCKVDDLEDRVVQLNTWSTKDIRKQGSLPCCKALSTVLLCWLRQCKRQDHLRWGCSEEWAGNR